MLLFKYAKIFAKKILNLNKIRRITNNALDKLRDNKMSLAKINCENAVVWNEIICKEFVELEKSFSENNSEKVIKSLNEILVFFDGKCRFESIEKFNNFFNDENQIFEILGFSTC